MLNLLISCSHNTNEFISPNSVDLGKGGPLIIGRFNK